jgi:quercetin dioxygenase-like cupin family protein
MVIAHEKDLQGMVMESPDLKNAAMKVLISPEEGWDDYVMRLVELDEGGYSPRHAHQWPHINYVVEGKGLLYTDGKNTPLETGSYALVPAGTLHQYKNDGNGKFRFICIVPREGHL